MKWVGGYTLGTWKAETDLNKAEIMAAYWWHCISENYAAEMRRLESDPEEKKRRDAAAQQAAQEETFRRFRQKGK
jgi:hypothetical protein